MGEILTVTVRLEIKKNLLLRRPPTRMTLAGLLGIWAQGTGLAARGGTIAGGGVGIASAVLTTALG